MPKLRRALGLPSMLFYGVGVVVGAGIYSVIGVAAGRSGRLLWLSVLLAAVPAGLAALCYAELATRYPKAGGAYVYVREAFPRREWLGFMVGWATVITTAATAATVAIGFAGYLQLFVGLPHWLSASLLLIVCTGVGIIGVRESAWVAAVCTTIEVAGLLAIIVVGAGADAFGERLLEANREGTGGVLAGAALVFFAYTGFEGLANLAEESRRPRRDLPFALLLSLGMTATLYVLVSIALLGLVEPLGLAQSGSPLATAAAARSGTVAAALGWVALFATANTALITLVVGARVVFGIAETGDLPRPLARTLPRRSTPWAAGLALLLLALAMVPVGGVGLVGSVSSLTTLFIFAAVAIALIGIRRAARDVRSGAGSGPAAGSGSERPFLVPGSAGGVPVVPVLLLLSIAPLTFSFEPTAHVVSAGALGCGFVLYIWRRRGRRS